MAMLQPSSFLRRVLAANAGGNALIGTGAILGTAPLAQALAIDPGVLLAAGIYLLLHAALGLWLAGRASLSEGAVWTLMGFNALFTFESIALLALGIVTPNLLGTLVACVEAWVALAFVELLHMGLARSVRVRVPLQGWLRGQS
jgi:hypothetical protein